MNDALSSASGCGDYSSLHSFSSDTEEDLKALGYRKELFLFLVSELLKRRIIFPLADQFLDPRRTNVKTRAMSIRDGVVAMELDSAGHEEPSSPLRDSTFSPAVHIQWQNSQSACAAMDELRVASSMPRHRKFESECFIDSPIPNSDVCLWFTQRQHPNLSRSISNFPHRPVHLPVPPPLILYYSHPEHACAPLDRAISSASRAAPRLTFLPRPRRMRPSFLICSAAYQCAWTRTPGSA